MRRDSFRSNHNCRSLRSHKLKDKIRRVYQSWNEYPVGSLRPDEYSIGVKTVETGAADHSVLLVCLRLHFSMLMIVRTVRAIHKRELLRDLTRAQGQRRTKRGVCNIGQQSVLVCLCERGVSDRSVSLCRRVTHAVAAHSFTNNVASMKKPSSVAKLGLTPP